MAIQGSDNQNSESAKKFLGLENFRVIAINPTSAEHWQNLGFNFEKEPEYVNVQKDDNGKEYTTVRIDFVLNNIPEEGESEMKVIHSIYVDDRTSESKTGKTLYCNKLGQFAWLPEGLDNIPENMSWFSTESARAAFKNEELLIDFLKNYSNSSKGQECFIENPGALLKGNVSEIRKVKEDFPNNKIKVNLAVKRVEVTDDAGEVVGEKFYQTTYSRKVERPYSNDFSYLRSNIDQWLENGGGANLIMAEFPYKLQEFNGVTPDDESAPTDEKAVEKAW